MTTEAMKENQEQAKLNAVEEAAKKNVALAGEEFDKTNEYPDIVESLSKMYRVQNIIEKGGKENLTQQEFDSLENALEEILLSPTFWGGPEKGLFYNNPDDFIPYNTTLSIFKKGLTVLLDQEKNKSRYIIGDDFITSCININNILVSVQPGEKSVATKINKVANNTVLLGIMPGQVIDKASFEGRLASFQQDAITAINQFVKSHNAFWGY